MSDDKIKYASLILAVASLGASAYLAYARFIQKKRTDAIPLYVSIGLTAVFFVLFLLIPKTPIEYTKIDSVWEANPLKEHLGKLAYATNLDSIYSAIP